ncbi:bacteriocin biosynthesis protein SagD [Gordoniibacillus kamchatkensis]|uniref:Bacteriocin biosynthesis protein SagD n=1 Tax=Gordoniibacillus kamchatkensis TaxID=1590651 RepID=A0ABR5AIT8_9BACL|nr:TOMM precursor leader peptide-binding protein [Paenibacillus sp. VKM B-2647]KIL40964.1 bacteriocin biosynthesis protein SagD [Paenibacillus sp. VKM B-2647]
MNGNVAVVGTGFMADSVCRQLNGRCNVARYADIAEGVPQAAELVIVADDELPSSGYFETEEAMRQAGVQWLRGFAAAEQGVVGPLVRPDRPGCSQCADDRRLTARGDFGGAPPLLREADGKSRHAGALRAGLRHISHLLAAETIRVLQGRRAHTENHLYLIDLGTLKSSLHAVLPDPLCPVCGGVPDDSEQLARISLQQRPKWSPDSYRCRPLHGLKETLRQYADPETGLINAIEPDLVSPFAAMNANVPSFTMGDEVTAGRSHRYEESRLTAILEGLERRCGQAPRGKRTAVRGSYNDVAGHALDPAKVGLYSPEQYALPDFPFEPYDPDVPLDWVWGYSLVQERPILVPECLAYYCAEYGDGFVQEGSNGCAIGGCIEEAILHGIMEVVERDSFLLTWYARLPVPRLDPLSFGDRELRLMIGRLRAVAGYEVHLFNTTMESGIPSIWAVAKSREPGKMNLVCAAGAHPDPLRAAKSAIHELAGAVLWLERKLAEHRHELVPMLDDPSLVQRMEHHALLYGLPQAEERLLFLLDERRPLRTFAEEFAPKASHADLTDDLQDMIGVFRSLNLDVIAVDQSSPETARSGLHCVKVLIPGMLPMTFGHQLARLNGLERVLRVPAELGYAQKPLTMDRLNPHPHPFL